MSQPLWLLELGYDARSRVVRSDLADPRSLKKSLMRLAPDNLGEGHRSKAGLLYRLERDNKLLVQTACEPDVGSLPEGYTVFRSVEFGSSFRPGLSTLVRYRCRATPVIRSGSKERWLVGEDETLWWKKRLALAGLTGRRDWEAEAETQLFRKWRALRYVDFSGIAEVSNSDALVAAVSGGVGRNKNWGAGLLSLARL